MNLISFHVSHEGCITYVKNNKIIFHTQLDRYNRFKWHTNPSKDLINFLKTLKVDVVLITFVPNLFGNGDNSLEYWKDVIYQHLPNFKKAKKIIFNKKHHLFHAYCALTWKKNIDNILVVDGGGSALDGDRERESFFKFSNNKLNHVVTYTKKDAPEIGGKYEQFTKKYFENGLNCGKTMAWSLYDSKPKQIQKTFEKEMNNLIEELQIKDEILFTGGCAQNILYNSHLLHKYKKVFCDPFNGDFGRSLGVANWYLNNNISNKEIYLGIPQNIETDLFLKHDIIKCSTEEVCSFSLNDPVAIFQSRSEQGQRGLGNRSLLMNPLHKNAHKKLNAIKKREWFRPFACSILKEKAKDWFEMNVDESPYMMYTFKLKKENILKTGVSIDNTSRIQTVSKKNNLHYYNLLKAFEKTSGVPILINTSLNLPGEVLVETLYDLKVLFENSNLKYIYLPEIETLIKKRLTIS